MRFVIEITRKYELNEAKKVLNNIVKYFGLSVGYTLYCVDKMIIGKGLLVDNCNSLFGYSIVFGSAITNTTEQFEYKKEIKYNKNIK